MNRKDFIMNTTIKTLVVWVDGSTSYQQVIKDRTYLEIEQLLEGNVDCLEIGREALIFFNDGASKGLPFNEVATEIARELCCDVGEGLYGNVVITGLEDEYGYQDSVPESLAEDIITISEMRCV